VKNVTHGVSTKCHVAHGAALNAQHHQHHQHQKSRPKKKMKRSKPKSKRKTKKKKLTSIPILTRRLFRLASESCREKAHFRCEICGMLKGTIHPNTGKPQRVEAHHVMSRSNKDSPLKFDMRNLICLCTEHHKTGRYSAHKHGIWFSDQFRKIRPKDYEWILQHSDDYVNLKDRSVLKYIEDCLRGKKNLEFDQEHEEVQLEFVIKDK